MGEVIRKMRHLMLECYANSTLGLLDTERTQWALMGAAIQRAIDACEYIASGGTGPPVNGDDTL